MQQAYNDYDAADAQAYKQSKGDAGELAKAAPQGAYPLSAGEGASKPRQRQDAATVDAKQAAYEQYDREMAVAYLRGK
jgi:hypothetical protein